MTKEEFYAELEEIIEADPGTIQGDEQLSTLDGWDSLAGLSFIAMADEKLHATLTAGALAGCKTVADLLNLFPGKITD